MYDRKEHVTVSSLGFTVSFALLLYDDIVFWLLVSNLASACFLMPLCCGTESLELLGRRQRLADVSLADSPDL